MTTAQLKKFDKNDWLIGFGLVIATALSRIPFVSRMIYEGDSVRFALAMEHYDVAQMRPHAPGYILYIALAKLADFFIHDAAISLAGISIISSALTIVFIYSLANDMYGRSTGIISSLILLSSPLFWFNGEMPLTYALEGSVSVIFGFVCYRLIIGEKKWLLISAIVLAIATGVRQNIVILLLPLWLYALKSSSLKQIFISFFFFGLVCLSWLVPMIALTGGVQSYFEALNAQFNTVVLSPAPFLWQIKIRGQIFSKFMVYSLWLGSIPLLYYLGRYFRLSTIASNRRLIFLLLWFFPAVVFFIGVNVYNPGHVIVILPPLMILLSEAIRQSSIDLTNGLKKLTTAGLFNLKGHLKSIFSYSAILASVVIFITSINSYIFLFSHTRVSYASIKESDYRLSNFVTLTREVFTPANSIILAFFHSTQATFYLPDYMIYCPFPLMFSPSDVPLEAQNVYISFRRQTSPKRYWIPTGFQIEPISLPPKIDTVIVWEKNIAGYYQHPTRPLREIKSKTSDTKIYFFNIKPEEKIIYDYHYLSIK